MPYITVTQKVQFYMLASTIIEVFLGITLPHFCVMYFRDSIYCQIQHTGFLICPRFLFSVLKNHYFHLFTPLHSYHQP